MLSAAILESGLNLSTVSSCKAAIYLCLTFYVGSKVCVQMFLVERAHAIRYKLKRRSDDVIWIVSMLIVAIGFGTIAVFAFMYPIADIAKSDGQCRIGLPLKVTVPLLTYDITINAALTAVFVALLRPLLKLRNPSTAREVIAAPAHHTGHHFKHAAQQFTSHFGGNNSVTSDIELQERSQLPPRDVIINPNVKALKNLVYKSLGGAVVVLIPTIVNLGLLYRWRGEEQGWLCFTICTVDGKSLRLGGPAQSTLTLCYSDLVCGRDTLLDRTSKG